MIVMTAMDRSIPEHIQGLATSLVVLVLLAAVGSALYNLFLDPLKSHPGPKLWAISAVPSIWHKVTGTSVSKLLELHRKYGHSVRIGPNEVSYSTASAWRTIYGHRSQEMAKSKTFQGVPVNGGMILYLAKLAGDVNEAVVDGIISSDRPTHSRQRRLMAHAFSEKALREQEGFIQEYVNKLIDLLSAKAKEGGVDMVRAYNFTTFDLIGDLSFGQSFGCLDNDYEHPIIVAMYDAIKSILWKGALRYYGLLRSERLFMSTSVATRRAQNSSRAAAVVDRRIDQHTDRKDFHSYILAANEEKGGMSREELHTNANILIVAGSETTATLLSGATYNILQNQQAYKTLVKEIRLSFSSEDEITLVSVNSLTYMLAVLDESLRVYPPVPDTLPRIVPAGGEIIDDRYVPAGTTVGVHQTSAHRLASNWYKPDDFIPERWLPDRRDTEPFKDESRAAMQAFSFGPRNCLGKNLAYAEMRLILAKVLWHFDLELMEESKSWQERQKSYILWHKFPLMCRLTPVPR